MCTMYTMCANYNTPSNLLGCVSSVYTPYAPSPSYLSASSISRPPHHPASPYAGRQGGLHVLLGAGRLAQPFGRPALFGCPPMTATVTIAMQLVTMTMPTTTMILTRLTMLATGWREASVNLARGLRPPSSVRRPASSAPSPPCSRAPLRPFLAPTSPQAGAPLA